MLRRLASLAFPASVLALVLGMQACSTTTNAPIQAADAGALPPEGSEEDDAAAPAPPPGDGNSGSPCTADSDCKGTGATCLRTLANRELPGGYCSAPCDPKTNTASEKNAKCPGTGAICAPDLKGCLAGCTEKQGARPCRAGYLCAYVGKGAACLPESFSECDLTKRGSCSEGKVCIIVGFDPIGLCDDACDLFAQACPSGGCYPNALGEGHCAVVAKQGADGDPCLYVNDCAPGLSCNDEGAERICRPLCGGPENKPCTNGKTCVDLSTSTNVSIAGVCAG